jgi:hypothetical protein
MNTYGALANNVLPTTDNTELQSEFQRLLTPRQVGLWLGVSERWVRDHATRRMPRIPAVKFGCLLRFRPADVEEFIATQFLNTTARGQRRR